MTNDSSTPVVIRRGPLFAAFLMSFLLTLCSMALVGFLWGKMGFDLLIVAMGWPHVIFGFLFNLAKVGNGGSRYRLALAALLLATIGIGYLSSFRALAGLVYPYFLFHAFRDEIFIYRQRLTGFRFQGKVFDRSGIGLLVGTIAAVLFAQLPARGARGRVEIFLALCAISGLLIALTYLGWPKLSTPVRSGLRYASGALLLFAALVTALKILRMQGMIVPSFLGFMVVFHYFSWYVFSLQKIGAQPPVPSPSQAAGSAGLLGLLRERRGFLNTVVLMNLLSFAGASGYYLLHLSRAMAIAFDLKFFMYVLVFHVTTSFVPKSSREILRPAASPGTPAHESNSAMNFVPILRNLD